MMYLRLHLGWLLGTALVACSSDPASSPASCDGKLLRRLVNASQSEVYLGLSGSHQRALVEIVSASLDGTSCSGAFVAPGWVLTAAHCDEIADALVVLAPGADASQLSLPVTRREILSDSDLALFQVSLDPQSTDWVSLDISPIQLPTQTLESVAKGVAVELAGYGLREDGNADELRFLVEIIVSTSAEWISVGGFGHSGACVGDSGGPLLMRDIDGTPVVAGVLSRGSATCLYDDVYARTDSSRARAWLESVVEARTQGTSDCGTISEQGRCLYGSALWCQGGYLHAELCSPNVCGWSVSASGFRCGDVSAPCAGADAIGKCQENAALRCVDARLTRQSCGACSACRVDGVTGIPACSP